MAGSTTTAAQKVGFTREWTEGTTGSGPSIVKGNVSATRSAAWFTRRGQSGLGSVWNAPANVDVDKKDSRAFAPGKRPTTT